MRNAWALLELEPGADRAAIRRAYAKKLKVTNPEDDPKGFMALRQAYEWLLDHVEYAASDFDDFRGGEAAEHRFSPDQLDAIGAATDPGDAMAPAAAVTEQRDPELDRIDELFARLADNLANGGMDGRPLSRELLADILASPAMLNLAVAARVEHALAVLVAQNVPNSDAIILPALDAFDWTDQRRAHHYPFSAVIARLDEWRIIQSFDRPSDPSHQAWRALVKLAPPPIRWLQARTRRRHDIADLIAFIDYQCPGIAFSASREAMDWWRKELAQDRETAEPWLMRLLAAGASFAALRFAGIDIIAAAATATLFFALLAVDRVAIRRFLQPRFDEPSRLAEGGLLAGIMALPLAGALLPIGWPSAAAIAVVAAALVWRLRWITGPTIDVPLKALIGPLVTIALLTVMFAVPDLPIALPALVMLIALSWVLFGQGPALRVRTAAALETVAGKLSWCVAVVYMALLLFAASSVGDEPVRAGIAFISAALGMSAANGVAAMAHRPPPSLVFGLMIIGTTMVLVGAMAAMSDPITGNDATAGQAIVAVRVSSPSNELEKPEKEAKAALDAMVTSNPTLLAAIDRAIVDNPGGIERANATQAVDRLIADAMRDRLLRSSDSLIAAEQRVRARLLDFWRAREIGVCATELRADPVVSADILEELRRVQLAVISQPLIIEAGRPKADPPPIAEWQSKVAAARRDADARPVKAGTKAPYVAKCNERLAQAQALASLSDAQIASARRAAERLAAR